MTDANVAAVYIGGFFATLVGALLVVLRMSRTHRLDGPADFALASIGVAAFWPIVLATASLVVAAGALARLARWTLR